MGACRLLVVSSDPHADILRGYLRASLPVGTRVQPATCNAHARRALRRDPEVRLVLADLEQPDGTAFELLPLLMPLVVLTRCPRWLRVATVVQYQPGITALASSQNLSKLTALVRRLLSLEVNNA